MTSKSQLKRIAEQTIGNAGACSGFNPCAFAKALESRGEEDRGRRDQEITKLRSEHTTLREALDGLVSAMDEARGAPYPEMIAALDKAVHRADAVLSLIPKCHN